MSQKEPTNNGETQNRSAKSQHGEREERLAAALRDNLKRRKAQVRGRQKAETGAKSQAGGKA